MYTITTYVNSEKSPWNLVRNTKAGALIAAEIDRLQRAIADASDDGDDEIAMSVTARLLLKRGLWQRACELTGLNEWAVNEGLMDEDDMVDLTTEQAKELGLLS